ncbi:hypothetical protein D5272_01345 [bacterium D16-76]|nr:hypothetical protein [bacterium D16-76]
MTKLEIVQVIANNHNRLSQIMVNGDNAILMGETIKEMRALVRELQEDIENEEESKNVESKTNE